MTSASSGLVKGGSDGAYQTAGRADAPNGQTPKPCCSARSPHYLLRVDRVQQLVLLRTGLGHAQSLCARSMVRVFRKSSGRVAGEDTILIITPDARRAKALVKRLERLQAKDSRVTSRVVLACSGAADNLAAIPRLAWIPWQRS